MNTFFNQYDFTVLLETPDLENAWAHFKGIISEATSQFVPKICSRKHPRPKWFNSDIQHQLNRVHTLRRRTRSNSTPALLSKLCNAEVNLSDAIANAKQNFESQLIHNLAANNSSQIFRYISTLTNNHQLPSVMYLGDSKASTGFDQAQLFNKYFHSVFTHSSYDSFSTVNLQVPNLSLSTVNITPLDVFQALSSLDPSKASGIDSISPAPLKNCAGSLTTPIHYLLTLSLGTQSLPLEWRTHCIALYSNLVTEPS